MKNYLQDGKHLDLTAPSGGVTSGTVYKIGSLIVVAVIDAAVGETFSALNAGVIDYAVATADTPAEGDLAYWDDTLKEMTTDPTGNTLAGWFVSAKHTGDIASIKLLGGAVA